MTKKIPIEKLKPGMYVVELDLPWHKTPFMSHKRLIKTEHDVARLKDSGVRHLTIDPAKGVGLGTSVEGERTTATKSVNGSSQSCDQVGAEVAEEKPSFTNQEMEQESSVTTTPATPYLRSMGGQTPRTNVSTPSEPSAPQRDSSSLRSGGAQSPTLLEGPIGPPGLDRHETERAKTLVKDMTMAVEGVFQNVNVGAPIEVVEVRKVVDTFLSQVCETPNPLFYQIQIQALRHLDANLFIHVVNVCVLTLLLGQKAGFEGPSLQHMGMGGLLHDIGHMRVPRNLLRKKGSLTKKERKVLEKHPELGASIIAQATDIDLEVRRIVAEHHERPDQSGYPHGLKGSLISPLTRWVSVADYYDSLLQGRSGQTPLSPAEAVRHVYNLAKTKAFDAEVVDRFINLIGVYPVGSLVEFDTGEKGIVLAQHSLHKTKPTVTIIADQNQRAHFLVDLALPSDHPSRKITRILDPVTEQINLNDYIEG